MTGGAGGHLVDNGWDAVKHSTMHRTALNNTGLILQAKTVYTAAVKNADNLFFLFLQLASESMITKT